MTVYLILFILFEQNCYHETFSKNFVLPIILFFF
jgi:hypothetical protein